MLSGRYSARRGNMKMNTNNTICLNSTYNVPGTIFSDLLILTYLVLKITLSGYFRGEEMRG